MNNFYIKIITGFRDNQYYVINAEEAHKAYYLFLNPEERAIFKNGVALIGKQIQGIEPAYNETMGWNPTHKLEDDDWNELREKGIDRKLKIRMEKAKNIAYLANHDHALLSKQLSEIAIQTHEVIDNSLKQLAEKLSIR